MINNQVFQVLAQTVGAYQRCKLDPSKKDWENTHKERILKIVKTHFPSGSGFDKGTIIDLGASTEEKLVFQADFHHMDAVKTVRISRIGLMHPLNFR